MSCGALSVSDRCSCLGSGCTAGLGGGARSQQSPRFILGPPLCLLSASPPPTPPPFFKPLTHGHVGQLSPGRSATPHLTGHSPVGLFSWLPCEPLGTPRAGCVPCSTADASGQITPCRGGCWQLARFMPVARPIPSVTTESVSRHGLMPPGAGAPEARSDSESGFRTAGRVGVSRVTARETAGSGCPP